MPDGSADRRALRATPEEIITIPGVVAAGRFHRNGKLRDCVSNRPMPPDIAEDIAEVGATDVRHVHAFRSEYSDTRLDEA